MDLESGLPFYSRLDDEKSLQIFNLKPGKEGDDMIQIEISPCKSDLSFWISDKIDPYSGEELGRQSVVKFINGRFETEIKPINQNHYLSVHLDKTIESSNNKTEICKYSEKNKCKVENSGSEYWVKYTSLKTNNYKANFIKDNGMTLNSLITKFNILKTNIKLF